MTFIKSEHIVSESVFNQTQSEEDFLKAEPMVDATPEPLDNVMYPSYLSNFAVLILIATAVIAQLTHVTKIILMVFITGNRNSPITKLLYFFFKFLTTL